MLLLNNGFSNLFKVRIIATVLALLQQNAFGCGATRIPAAIASCPESDYSAVIRVLT